MFLAQRSCPPLLNSAANTRNAEWFPKTCATDEQRGGTRCYMQCQKGYQLKPNALASVDCINSGEKTWSQLELVDICEKSKFDYVIQYVLINFGTLFLHFRI